MNQSESNASRGDDQGKPIDPEREDRPIDGTPESEASGDDQASQTAGTSHEEPSAVTVQEVTGEPDVRVGSPFAVDPMVSGTSHPVESFQDLGPMKYTAMGAISASTMVVGFAATAVFLFPAGGTLIAALGCLLSIVGMYSSYRLTAACLLTVHLCLFVLSYGRTLG